MNGKRKLSLLLVFAMIVSLLNGIGTTLQVQAAEPTWIEAYKKASYETESPDFKLEVGGTPVDVVQYYHKENVRNGYSYAHLAYEGTATFEITCLKGNIEAVDASPHSYNMDVKISGNKFTFDLAQAKSRYMVFDVRAAGNSYQLIVAADPKLDLTAPAVDSTTVVSAKEGMPSIGVGGLSSTDKASEGKNNTNKIQKIISELSRNGGGTLYFPAGVYTFVTIDAVSNVTLYLDEGAVLRGSGIRTDYDWSTTGANGIQAKERDIRIKNVENFKIIGKGMVDANSIAVSQKGKTSSGSRELNNDPQPADWYPDGWNDYRKGIVDANEAHGIEFKGVTFKDATGWTFNIKNSYNIEMNNVKMLDDYTVVHSDGYDIVSCQDVNVQNCFAVCGDDAFCPKGDTSGRTMKNYLFKDCVAYAEGGAGCKIGVQARSDVSNIEFNNIDVIRGYRGFSIAHDEGEGNWDGIYFRNIRTEKLYIPSFSRAEPKNYGQYTSTPFTLWLLSNGAVKNVEITNCSFESISNLRAIIKGKSGNGKISDVTFNNLTIEGRTVTSLDDARLAIGDYVDRDSFKFNNTQVYAPETDVYEGEDAVLERGAKKTQNTSGSLSNDYKVSNMGLTNGQEGTATFNNVNVDQAGEYSLEVYGITKLARAFYITVNGGTPQMINCNGDGWTLQGRTTTKIYLNAGNNTIKLGNPYAAAPDLDKIEIVRSGSLFDPNADTDNGIVVEQPVSLTVDKGLLVLDAGAKVNNSGLIGDIGGADNGTAAFHVQTSKAGAHILRIYYASMTDRTVSVTVNNSTPVTMKCAGNGSWDKPGANPAELAVALQEGDNTVVIGGVDGGDAPNIDRIAVSLSDEEAQATVSAWIEGISRPAASADRAYIDAVKKAYDSLTVKDKIANAGRLEEALEELEGRTFFTVPAETAETAGPAKIVADPNNPEDYHIGELGGGGHGAAAFYVNAGKAGERILKIYYSTMQNRSLNVVVNDGNPVTLNAKSTGSWDVAGEIPLTMNVKLKQGINKITFSGNGDDWAPNIDRIEIALTAQEIKDTVEAIIGSLPDAEQIASGDGQLKIKTDAISGLYDGLTDKEGVNTEKLTEVQGTLNGTAAVEEVITAIYGIGTVTLNSEAGIQSAREKYDALTEKQKELVTNYGDLEKAEAKYRELKEAYDADQDAEEKDRIAAGAVVESISGLGEISLKDGGRIQTVRDAYEALTEEQKKLVTNYGDLEKAEETYRQLQQEKTDKDKVDKAAADAVAEAISGIEITVTLDSEEKIRAARAAYEALTDDQKKLVGNYSSLEVAEKNLEKLKEDAGKEGSDEGRTDADKEAADKVVEAIYGIGTVTLNSEAKIEAAREAYNALTEDQMNYVSNYYDLVMAEEDYAQLKKAYEEAGGEGSAAGNEIAANAVIESIANLADVSLKEKDRIEEARGAYENLTEEQKKLVPAEDYANLEKAEGEYRRLRNVADLISAIGNVTIESGERIRTAREAYDALGLGDRAYLLYDSYVILNEAEAVYRALKEQKDAVDLEAAKVVADLISGIGNVTLDSGGSIAAARAAYDALTGDQQNLVENYQTLLDAENKIKELQKPTESGNNTPKPDDSDAAGNQPDNDGAQTIPVKSIKITGISKKIAAGKKVTLSVIITPKDATDPSVTWSTSNKKYATVDKKTGRISVKKAGKNKKVTIYAAANDGSGKKASYTITIMPKAVTKVKIQAKTKSVKAGKSLTLKAVVTPKLSAKKVNKTVQWSSGNTRHATVTKKGVVKTKKAGKGKKVKITANATDGSSKKAAITISIK